MAATVKIAALFCALMISMVPPSLRALQAAASGTETTRDPKYPPPWWTPASKEGAPSWEIFPPEAGPGEVISFQTK